MYFKSELHDTYLFGKIYTLLSFLEEKNIDVT